MATVSAASASEENAEWRLEQPMPPTGPPGVEATGLPVGIGAIGDIEFWSPNRGALITAGNGGSITPGVWLYNGSAWRELATKCGATDGRIAWAGPDEFWTISDGRTGQAEGPNHRQAPLQDNTLCRFAVGASGDLEIVDSYATLGFQSTSYPAMHAAACIGPEDCWFGGEKLEAPQIGAFELHWNGHTLLREPYLDEGHTVEAAAVFEGDLYESLRLAEGDRDLKHKNVYPTLLLDNPLANGGEVSAPETLPELPESPQDALEPLVLGADEGALWAATGPAAEVNESPKQAVVTVARYSQEQYEFHEYLKGAPRWKTVFEPTVVKERVEGEVVEREVSPFPEGFVPSSIAPEPNTTDAWLAMESHADQGQPFPTAPALIARIGADGIVSNQVELGTKGAASHVTCPAEHDCWLVTTGGWLFHYATQNEREHPEPATDPAFTGEYLITSRPTDESLPEVPSVTLPENDSGTEEAPAPPPAKLEKTPVAEPFLNVIVPLVSDVHTRLVDRTTLKLSFRLSVKARVRLIAQRKHAIVASTARQTLAAGSHSLLLRLNVRRWPTKLDFQTRALAPLKTVSTRESGSATESVSTSLRFLNAHGLLSAGLLH
jgi:hypothetical protein